MLVIGLLSFRGNVSCINDGISRLPFLYGKAWSSCVLVQGIRRRSSMWSYLGSMWFPLVIQCLKSGLESAGEISLYRSWFGSVNGQDELGWLVCMSGVSLHLFLCVVVRLHGCCIYMYLIRIYTLPDSQYKSFYEHLYQCDGSLSTLSLLRSDCYISVTALPLPVTLTDTIDRLY